MDTQKYDLQSNDAKRMKKQIEFYFSDSNYPSDKFMRKVASENNGYIPISVFTTFNRVKNISQDVGFITAVLESSDFLEVSDGKVKRKTPIPEKDTSNNRTIYVKGIPSKKQEVTIDEITEFFSKFGNVLAIRQRRFKNREFKGSAYIEFSTEEEAKKVLDSKDLRWNDACPPFIILSKDAHLAEKEEEYKTKKLLMENESNEAKEKTKLEKTENTENSEKSEKTEDTESPEKSEKTEKPEKKEKSEKFEREEKNFTDEVPANFRILEVKNVPNDIDIYDLKAHFSKFGKPKFIDNSQENGTIIVRFVDLDHVDVAYNEIKDTKFEIRGNVVEARIISQEEAEQYWKDKIKPQIKRPNQMGGRGGYRGGRGQFKRGRGRSRGRGKGGPPFKKRKLNPKE